MEELSFRNFMSRLSLYARSIRYAKQLFVPPDLAERIASMTLEGKPTLPGAFDNLLGISLIVTDDQPPGSFRLVRHDNCRVIVRSDAFDKDASYVSHSECSILEEGTVRD
jgi:hypothetical protein